MKLKNSFYVTIFIYGILLAFPYFKKENSDFEKIEIEKGSAQILSFVFPNTKNGIGSQDNIKTSDNTEGAISEEVNKIRNKILYPPQALEDGLESDCEWSLQIDANQSAKNIKIIQPCKYKIFEEEFQRVIHNWKFNLPENTSLTIPVSFKIK